MALFGGTADGQNGDNGNNGKGGDVGLSLGHGAVANGENGGLAIGAGSDANGGGMAIEGGDTEVGGGFADDGATHPGCDIAIDHDCFNEPGRKSGVWTMRQNSSTTVIFPFFFRVFGYNLNASNGPHPQWLRD